MLPKDLILFYWKIWQNSTSPSPFRYQTGFDVLSMIGANCFSSITSDGLELKVGERVVTVVLNDDKFTIKSTQALQLPSHTITSHWISWLHLNHPSDHSATPPADEENWHIGWAATSCRVYNDSWIIVIWVILKIC